MKHLYSLIIICTAWTAQAQVEDVKTASDLGQRMFGESAPVELSFANEYRFLHLWQYKMTLDGPTASGQKVVDYDLYQNPKDSTLLMMDKAEESKTIHDARIDGLLTLPIEGEGPCLQVRKSLKASKSSAYVFSQTGQVEIVNGWKCELYLYEDDYNEYEIWINHDMQQGLLMKQLGALLSIRPMLSATISDGMMVRYQRNRKASGKAEVIVDLMKEKKDVIVVDAAPCWEIKKFDSEDED